VSSLEAENQDLPETLQALPEELNKVSDVASVKPEHSPGIVAELHAKLKSAEEKVVALESHAATRVEKAKSAELKARSSEEKLVAKTKEFEATIQEKARSFEERLAAKTRQLETEFREKAKSFEEKMVAKTQELEAAFRRNYQPTPDQRLKRVAGTLAAIALLVGGVAGYATGRHGANQKVSSLTNALRGSEGQRELMEGKLTSVQLELKATQGQLTQQIAKEGSPETVAPQTQGQLAACSQQLSHLQSTITSQNSEIARLHAQATAAIPDSEILHAQAAAAIPDSGVLIWSGTLASKTQIDIKNGVANYGTVRGVLPGKPCNLSICDTHVRLTTPPTAGNQWNRVSFEVLGAGNFKVYINWELAR
jgi:hypothetical protein